MCESGGQRLTRMLPMILGFELHRRNVADWLKQPVVVEPMHPFQGCEFDVFKALPWAASPDHLRFEEADHGFCQGIVVGIADTADGRLDPGLTKTFSVSNGQILLGFKESSQHWLLLRA